MISDIQLEFPLPRVLIRRAALQWVIGIGRDQSAREGRGEVSDAVLCLLDKIGHRLAACHVHLACLHKLLDRVPQELVLGHQGRGVPAQMLTQLILILERAVALWVHAVIRPALLDPVHLLMLLQRRLVVETLKEHKHHIMILEVRGDVQNILVQSAFYNAHTLKSLLLRTYTDTHTQSTDT